MGHLALKGLYFYFTTSS